MNKLLHKYIIELFKVEDGIYKWNYLYDIEKINGKWTITTCLRAEKAMGFVTKKECQDMVKLINETKLRYKAMMMDGLSCLANEGSITEDEYKNLINNRRGYDK